MRRRWRGPDPREGVRHAVFTAIKDQIGLRFVPHKITVGTLVIDNVERALAELMQGARSAPVPPLWLS